MQLDLQPNEVLLLTQVLQERLSDLRMEISNTEQYEMREALKREEATIKSLIVRLEQMSPARRRLV
jgi:hypothetical protein